MDPVTSEKESKFGVNNSRTPSEIMNKLEEGLRTPFIQKSEGEQ